MFPLWDSIQILEGNQLIRCLFHIISSPWARKLRWERLLEVCSPGKTPRWSEDSVSQRPLPGVSRGENLQVDECTQRSTPQGEYFPHVERTSPYSPTIWTGFLPPYTRFICRTLLHLSQFDIFSFAHWLCCGRHGGSGPSDAGFERTLVAGSRRSAVNSHPRRHRRRRREAGHRRDSASDHDHHRPESGRSAGKVGPVCRVCCCE